MPFQHVGENQTQGTVTAFSRSGDAYLELIGVRDGAPFREGQRLRQERYPNLKFRTVEIVEAGGGVTSFAVVVPNLDLVVERLRKRGLPIADPVRRGQVRPNGKSDWALAGLTEGPTWLPFFIEYAVPGEERLARLPSGGWSIDHIVLETEETAASGRQLATLLELELRPHGPDRFVVPLPGAHIHFVPGPAERITTVVFAGSLTGCVEVSGLSLVR